MILTTLELGFITSIVVMSLFLSYTSLNVCDLSTDGCFTLGAVSAGILSLRGFIILPIIVSVISGIISGFVTSILQTKMKINSLLAGIVVNTGLYSVNIALMKGSAQLNLNRSETLFTGLRSVLSNSFAFPYYKIIIVLIISVLVYFFLLWLFSTRLGLAIRATGDNPIMVSSSSINPDFTTIIGLCVSGGITALSGCVMALYTRSVDINMGTGIVTVALASLLIGRIFFKRSHIWVKLLCAVLGALIFRSIYTIALAVNIPSYMLKLVSSIIVVAALYIPTVIKKNKKREIC